MLAGCNVTLYLMSFYTNYKLEHYIIAALFIYLLHTMKAIKGINRSLCFNMIVNLASWCLRASKEKVHRAGCNLVSNSP